MSQTCLLPSRGRRGTSYYLITTDNLVPNALPEFEDVVVRLLATPRWPGTLIGQYLLDFGPSGHTVATAGEGFENFLYQVEGRVVVDAPGVSQTLSAGAYCYLPEGAGFSLEAQNRSPSRTLWTKRRYQPVEGLAYPSAIIGHHSDIEDRTPEPCGTYVYRELIPTADRAHDMAMNILIADPGGSIGQVEMHHQEHGLLMLSGQGIYYLDGDSHEVVAGDYIYMAPYCPQSFFATGSETASYLLYKDINRDGF